MYTVDGCNPIALAACVQQVSEFNRPDIKVLCWHFIHPTTCFNLLPVCVLCTMLNSLLAFSCYSCWNTHTHTYCGCWGRKEKKNGFRKSVKTGTNYETATNIRCQPHAGLLVFKRTEMTGSKAHMAIHGKASGWNPDSLVYLRMWGRLSGFLNAYGHVLRRLTLPSGSLCRPPRWGH